MFFAALGGAFKAKKIRACAREKQHLNIVQFNFPTETDIYSLSACLNKQKLHYELRNYNHSANYPHVLTSCDIVSKQTL